MAGVKKPNPIIYEYALSVSNAQKESSIMIGDCIDADVLGAINFGIDAILINHADIYISQKVTEINHLLDLKRLF